MKRQLREHANAHRTVGRDWEVAPGTGVTGKPTIYIRFGRYFELHLGTGNALRIANAIIDALEEGTTTKHQHRRVKRDYAIADQAKANERKAT